MNNDKNLKFLSVNNALGFLTNKPTEILLPELWVKIHEICLNFKAEMLGEIYSDGTNNNNELIIFTSIGSKLNPKEENLKHLIFEPHLLIKSYDFDSLRPNQLKEYYDDLLQKYGKVYNSIAVSSGLTFVSKGFSGFNGQFTLASNLDWQKTIKTGMKKREDAKAEELKKKKG